MHYYTAWFVDMDKFDERIDSIGILRKGTNRAFTLKIPKYLSDLDIIE
jgi:hypothetical protein